VYKALFDNIVANRHNWRLFYCVPNMQHVWAERSYGAAAYWYHYGTLATGYRMRGGYDACDRVMPVYK